MFVKTAARSTAILVAALSSVLAYRTYSEEPSPIPTITEVTAVGAGSPKAATCGEFEASIPCVAVPVFVKAKDETGEMQELSVSYTVGGDLVDRIKQDFGDATTVLLRNIQDSLRSGLKEGNGAVKGACKAALPAINASVPYQVKKGIAMPMKIEQKVAEVAEGARSLMGHKIVVTSGNRTPTEQAEAMKVKMSMGENLRNLYANKQAINEVLWAHHLAKKSRRWTVGAMADVIANQMKSGVYLSNHLHEGAVDIRSHDLNHMERMAVLRAVTMVPGVRASIESTPPHFHLDIN